MEEENVNFFMVPHVFEEEFGTKLTPSEKYFVITLMRLENKFNKKGDFFWHKDKVFLYNGQKMGFKAYGFSVSFCKKARKKLQDLGLIKTKYGTYRESGYRSGTFYRINHNIFRFYRYAEKSTDPKVQNELCKILNEYPSQRL